CNFLLVYVILFFFLSCNWLICDIIIKERYLYFLFLILSPKLNCRYEIQRDIYRKKYI
ncbi:unnamed protein product, partial [Tenebrio molitor]